MGCSSSVVPLQQASSKTPNQEEIQNHQKSQTPVQLLDLTQQHIITKTWRQLQANRACIGKKVFLRIFEVEPRVKTAFKLGSMWGDDLLNNDTFKRHANRFVESIGYVVDNVYSLQEHAEAYVMDIGADHTKRPGFSVQFFDVFVKSLLFVWQQEIDDQFTPDVEAAWLELFQYVAQKTKEGYESASQGKGDELQTQSEVKNINACGAPVE